MALVLACLALTGCRRSASTPEPSSTEPPDATSEAAVADDAVAEATETEAAEAEETESEDTESGDTETEDREADAAEATSIVVEMGADTQTESDAETAPADASSDDASAEAEPAASSTPTWTPESTVAPAPTATPAPADEVFPVRLEISADTPTQRVEGELSAGAATRYLVDGQAGQRLAIQAASPQAALSMSITGEDGAMLRSQEKGGLSWAGVVPSTQEYVITLSAPEDAAYTLEVMQVPAQFSTTGDPEPLEFAADGTSETVTGDVAAGEARQYLVTADAGQILSVELASPDDGAIVLLGIRGAADGSIYKHTFDGASRWMGALPAAQAYVLSVAAAGAAADYTLDVVLEDSTFALTDTEPERVTFEPDTLVASRQGILAAKDGVRQFALSGDAGQLLTIISYSTGAPIQIVLEDAAGERWVSDLPDGLVTELSVRLPDSGEMVATLLAPLAAGDAEFRADFILSE